MVVMVKGKTLEKAIAKGLEELNTTKEHVKIEVIKEGKKGIFGLLKGEVTISMERIEDVPKTEDFTKTEDFSKTEISEDVQTEKNLNFTTNSSQLKQKKAEKSSKNTEENAEKLVEIAKKIIGQMGGEVTNITYGRKKGYLSIYISMESELLTKKEETLKGLETILGVIYNNWSTQYEYLEVDCNGTKQKRQQKLEEFARKVAQSVIQTKKNTVLNNMTRYERKIIHTVIQEYEELETVSLGKEGNRKVKVLYLPKGKEIPVDDGMEPIEKYGMVKQSVDDVTKVKIF